MADISDVEHAIVDALAASLFPSQAYSDGAVAMSAAGEDARLFRGWPLGADLDQDMRDGVTNVTVYPVPGMGRNSSRFLQRELSRSKAPQTLAATVSGSSVTFSGTGSAAHLAGVGFGAKGYAYRLLPTDTPNSVAAALRTLIPGATGTGAVVNVPTSLPVVAPVETDTRVVTETRRQSQMFWVMVHAPDPAARDKVGKWVSDVMASLRSLALADGAVTDLPRYAGTWINDGTQTEKVWRRDERYEIDYPTTKTEVQPAALFVGGKLLTGIGVNAQASTTIPGSAPTLGRI